MSTYISESLVTSRNKLDPAGSGKPLMFATVALAATSAPPITTSFELLAGAKSCIPLLSGTSSLLLVNWSSDVAVEVTTNVLKLEVGNEGLPVSVTISAMSVTSASAPLTSLGVEPNSET